MDPSPHTDEKKPLLQVAVSGKTVHKRWWVVAVSVILLLGTWWLIRLRNAPPKSDPSVDIRAPVHTRATLTLASGRQATLGNSVNDPLPAQGGAQIVQDADGNLVYKADLQQPVALSYNTLSNPRGSTVVDVTLSDGTRVWLNAGSSIRYPAVFPGNDRTVEVSGEAYFEVASDAQKPFRVKRGNTTVYVLGTSFNIRAYNDDPLLRVTLLNGKVRVTAANEVTIEAGGQAVVQDRAELVKDVDLDAVMAWKHGLFSFSHSNLVSTMNELSRWYDVNVTYDNYTSDHHYTGKLDRTLTLDQVLKELTDGRLHYSIDSGRHQLRVMP